MLINVQLSKDFVTVLGIFKPEAETNLTVHHKTCNLYNWNSDPLLKKGPFFFCFASVLHWAVFGTEMNTLRNPINGIGLHAQLCLIQSHNETN